MDYCNAQMASVAGGGFIYCNSRKGHEGPHTHTYPSILMPRPQTEITSLTQIKAKLDSLLEGQGKLYSALSERNESLTDIRTDLKALYGKLDGLEAEFSADFAKLYNGHGLALQKLGDLIDAWNMLMKQRPKRGKRRSGKRAGER